MTCKLKVKEKSIYDQIGLEGLIELLIDSSSYPMNLLSFPYNVIEYRKVLKNVKNISELYDLHARTAMNSRVFSVLSPSYNLVKEHLMIKHEIL